MGEKRKLSSRDRGGSAAKKRISEAAASSPASATPSKKKASPPAQPQEEEPPEPVLPTKVKDSEKLPTVPKPQVSGLLSQDYQTFAESGVLNAALHRSRTKWLQDSIFEKYWVKPSKKKSQPQPAFQNPPRESMVKLGHCSLVVEPHHFDAVLYTVRDPRPPQPAQNTSQAQRPIVQYALPANPNNFHQFQPRPPQNQPRMQNQYPGPDTPPASSHYTTNRQPTQVLEQQGHSNAATPTPPPPQQPTPTPPPPPQAQPQPQPQQQYSPHEQAAQPEQPPQTTQHAPLAPAPAPAPVADSSNQVPIAAAPPVSAPSDPSSQAAKPSPDPVIQMLATRAASNPDLKALMRVVASSKANQEQLRAFQAHIDELNAILASRQKDHPNSPYASSPHPPHQPGPTTSYSGPPPPTPNSGHAPVHNTPAPQPPPPIKHSRPPQSSVPPIRSKNPNHGPASQAPYFQQQTPPPPPPKQDIKSVVLEFVPPTGSTAAAHGASGDRYLFPVNTILDYFPGHTTVIASFLVTKKFDPSAPQGGPAGSQVTGKGKSKKSKNASTPSTATPAANTPDGQPGTPAPQQEAGSQDAESENPPAADAKTDSKVKEYYQPVTMRLHASNPKILDPLSRVVKPPAEVRQYMNDAMDRMERADIEYLALRLPREKSGRAALEDRGLGEDAGGSGRGAKQNSINTSSTGATAKTKGKDVENDTLEKTEDDEEEDMEELREFYDAPCGLVPLG